MNIFKRLFKKPTIQCPRCLGKGHVDLNDIQRLNKELVWNPGKCAYCNGFGKVHEETLSTVSADFSYLTTSISKIEQWKILNGNSHAKKRAQIHQEIVSEIIDGIVTQYYVDRLDLETITDLHFLRFSWPNVSDKDKNDFIEYAEKVIAYHKDKYQ